MLVKFFCCVCVCVKLNVALLKKFFLIHYFYAINFAMLSNEFTWNLVIYLHFSFSYFYPEADYKSAWGFHSWCLKGNIFTIRLWIRSLCVLIVLNFANKDELMVMPFAFVIYWRTNLPLLNSVHTWLAIINRSAQILFLAMKTESKYILFTWIISLNFDSKF